MQSNLITAIVPYGIVGRAIVSVTAEVDGIRSNVARIGVLPAVPALITDHYGTLVAASALNQDQHSQRPGQSGDEGIRHLFVR